MVKHFPPGAPSQGLDLIKMFVNQQEHAPTTGAGIKQLVNVVFSTATKTLIDHLAARLWKNVFPYIHRKLIKSHDSFLRHEIAAQIHDYLKSHQNAQAFSGTTRNIKGLEMQLKAYGRLNCP
jgi:hypothetical protein